MLNRKTTFTGGMLLYACVSCGTPPNPSGPMPLDSSLLVLSPSRPNKSEALITELLGFDSLVPISKPPPHDTLDFSALRFLPAPTKLSIPYVLETWTGLVTEEEVRDLDKTFPHLGFGLAWYITQTIAQKGEAQMEDIKYTIQMGEELAQEIFGNSLKPFNPESGKNKDMRQGIFQFKIFILKSKNNGRVSNEAEAGTRIRQKVVEIYINNERDINKTLAEFKFLAYLVAPIDCGNYIASLKVPNPISLHDIIFSDRKQFAFGDGSTAKQSSDGFPMPDFGDDDSSDSVPIPDFGDGDGQTSLQTLFPDMNFGSASERICTVQNMVRLVGFLHDTGIVHNDFHSGNFLIGNNDYAQLFLIDFDQATCRQKFSPINDQKNLINVIIEYLFGTTREILHSLRTTEETFFSLETIEEILLTQINDLHRENLETLQYTDEKLKQIEGISLNLIRRMLTNLNP